ncbi:MAG TPA: sulfotransferase [Thermodesulfobacteriota bacterium]
MTIRPPIIIVGMSRSGTGVLTKMLEGLGLFVGSRKERNHEALFFEKLNKWLLYQCSGGLENPESIKYLLEDEESRRLFANFLRFIMKTPLAISFLGLRKYLRYYTPANLDIPWGWKDPRNTYTLPIWLDIFPYAKVIHIYRHGVDVVHSLRVRREKGLSRLKDRHARFKSLYWFYLTLKFVQGQRTFVDLRCSSMEEALNMWEDYIQEARSNVSRLKEGAMEIKYEDLLTEPVSVLRNVANFCELDTSTREIEFVTQDLKRNRAYAYLDDPKLRAFAASVADRLKIYGY